MKILQLIPQFCYPADEGGKIGIANIYEEFSTSEEVTLFSLSNKKINSEHYELASQFGNVFIQYANTRNSFRNIFKSLFTKEPLYLFKHYSKDVIKQVEKIVETNSFDIIHADHTAMAPLAYYIKRKYGIPIGLRLHNIEYKIWERYSEELKYGSLKRKYIDSQASKLENKESILISKMDVNFVITDVDKKRAIKLSPKANIVVASAGVSPNKWFAGKLSQRQPKQIIIASTWNWIHNSNGLRWWVEKVLPLVKSKINDVELIVIGKDSPNFLKNNINIEPVGYVEEVLPYFHNSNIYIAPLFVGSGIRIKILEAMAAGLPVVSTSVSAEGIIASPEQGLFVSDDADAQAAIIVSLIKNKQHAYDLGQKAREFILEHHTWETNVNIIKQEYQKLIEK
ncbi:glycosyltransferase [Candidatus Kapabacteria bacterium]|nr:glycosyltransferase [Candidatus Kapabacteria bacterium]